MSATFRIVDGLDIVRLVLERMFEVATVVRSVLLLRLINCDASRVTRDGRVRFDLSAGEGDADSSNGRDATLHFQIIFSNVNKIQFTTKALLALDNLWLRSNLNLTN